MKSVVGRKVGHTGTLDPFATGLLVALAGRATRCARYFSGLPKRYEATYRFGTATDTDDSTGQVIATADLPDLSSIDAVLTEYTGTFEQRPPDYSAVHVDGKRAYAIARSGERPKVALRTVTVYEHTVVAAREAEVDVSIACSSGTYVRSLARDIGTHLGSVAHVSALRRTSVGPFAVDEAVAPDAFAESDLHALGDALVKLPGLVVYELRSDVAKIARNGGRIRPDQVCANGTDPSDLDAPCLLIGDGDPIAIGLWGSDRFDYHAVLSGPADADE